MDDQTVLLLGTLVTVIIGLISGGLLMKLRSLLGNLADLFIAMNNCLDKDCTTLEIKAIVKEGQETVADGLGIVLIFKGLIGR